jgi:hypothetical protein
LQELNDHERQREAVQRVLRRVVDAPLLCKRLDQHDERRDAGVARRVCVQQAALVEVEARKDFHIANQIGLVVIQLYDWHTGAQFWKQIIVMIAA